MLSALITRCRHRVVSNSRMLILPGVRVANLASHALAAVLRRARDDWLERYGYAPVIAETFVSEHYQALAPFLDETSMPPA